jgi:hypothetical protein
MITAENLYSYFDKFHGPVEPSTNDWYTCNCPMCGKPKFALNFNYKVAKCYRGCFRSFAINAVMLYHGVEYREACEIVEVTEDVNFRPPAAVKRIKNNARIVLPYGYQPILEGTTNLAVRAREYLQGRHFDLNYMDRIGVGYCNEQHDDPLQNYFGYIIVPFKRKGL